MSLRAKALPAQWLEHHISPFCYAKQVLLKKFSIIFGSYHENWGEKNLTEHVMYFNIINDDILFTYRLYAGQKQQLELDMEQQTASK